MGDGHGMISSSLSGGSYKHIWWLPQAVPDLTASSSSKQQAEQDAGLLGLNRLQALIAFNQPYTLKPSNWGLKRIQQKITELLQESYYLFLVSFVCFSHV